MQEVEVEPHLILPCQFMIDITEEQKDWLAFQTLPSKVSETSQTTFWYLPTLLMLIFVHLDAISVILFF